MKTELENSLLQALVDFDNAGDIVIATADTAKLTRGLSCAIRGAYDGMYGEGAFTSVELQALSALIFEAVTDERFFDSEKPVLTGLSKAEFEQLGRKLSDLS